MIGATGGVARMATGVAGLCPSVCRSRSPLTRFLLTACTYPGPHKRALARKKTTRGGLLRSVKVQRYKRRGLYLRKEWSKSTHAGNIPRGSPRYLSDRYNSDIHPPRVEMSLILHQGYGALPELIYITIPPGLGAYAYEQSSS